MKKLYDDRQESIGNPTAYPVRQPERLRNNDETVWLPVARIAARGFEERGRDLVDEKGRLGWSLKPARMPHNRGRALEEAARRGELLRGSAEKPVRLSPSMRQVVAGFGRSLPFFGAEVVWAYDDPVAKQRNRPLAVPRLFLQVTFHDPAMRDMYSRLSLTADLPPDTDVSRLNPNDFDKLVVAYGQDGQNEQALMYRLTPHPIEPGAS